MTLDAFLKSRTNKVFRDVVAFGVLFFILTTAVHNGVAGAYGTYDRTSVYAGVLIVIPIQLVLHETAHAVAALVFRRRVVRMVLGAGPTLLTFHIRGCEVQIRPLLWSGYTMYTPALPRGRRGVVSAAGPAVNALLAVIAALLLPVSPLMVGALWLNADALITNLWPARVRMGGSMVFTDGASVLRAIAATDSEEQRQGGTLLRVAVEESLARSGQPQANPFDLLTALLREPCGRGGAILHRSGLTLAQARSLASLAGRDGAPDPMSIPDNLTSVGVLDALRRRRDVGDALQHVVRTRLSPDGDDGMRAGRLRRMPIEEALLANLALERLSAEAVVAIERARHLRVQGDLGSSLSLLAALTSDATSVAARTLHAVGLPRPVTAAPGATRGLNLELIKAVVLGMTSPLFSSGRPITTAALLTGVWLNNEDSIAVRTEARGVPFMTLLDALRQQEAVAPGERSCQDGPERTLSWLADLRAHAQLRLGRSVAAYHGFKALASSAGDERTLALALNNAAWAALMSDHAELRAEALALSGRAVQLDPQTSAVRGTHAFALIENGQPHEGVVLIVPLVAKAVPENKATQECVLAIGLARLGMLDDACRYAEDAARLDPEEQLLPRAQAALGRARAAAPAGTTPLSP